MPSNLSVVYEWNSPAAPLRVVLDGVDPSLYNRIDLTVVMSSVRLALPDLTLDECCKQAELYNGMYFTYINRRY